MDNRGAVAFGTAQEYLLLRHELTSSHDTVLLMFYSNDLANNVDGDGARPFFELADGDLLLRNSPARVPGNGFDSFAAAHSRAYSFLEFALGTLKRRFRGKRVTNAAIAMRQRSISTTCRATPSRHGCSTR